jgi:hypothetical protein
MSDGWDGLLDDILADEGAAAKAMLASGHPIYYVEADTPDSLLIKEYPDGRRELVRCDTPVDEVVCEL